jgi:exodeoxyribonuclease III
MKIISWNVNGIRAAFKNGFLDFLSEHQPDILGLQEIKGQRIKVEAEIAAIEDA